MKTKKEEISVKQVGQNLIVVVNDEKVTKKISDKEKRDALKAKVLTYNEKPTIKLYKEILKEIEVKTEAVSKVEKANEVKIQESKAKAAKDKKVSKKEEAKVKEAKKKPQPKAVVGNGYRGEY